MSGAFDFLGAEEANKLEPVWDTFIPNEKIEIVVQSREEFIVLTNRRLVLLDSQKGPSKSEIRLAFPLDTISSLQQKEYDKWRLEIIKRTKDGNLDGKIKSAEMKYKTYSIDISTRYIEGMKTLHQKIEEKKHLISDPEYLPNPDVSYISKLRAGSDIDTALGSSLLGLSKDDEPAIIISLKGGWIGIDNEKTSYRYEIVTGTHRLPQSGTIPNILVCGLDFNWKDERHSHFFLYWHKYNVYLKEIETNSNGTPKTDGEYFPLENKYSETELLPWKRPKMNVPWILADAYFYKTKKFIAANIPRNDAERPRLWY